MNRNLNEIINNLMKFKKSEYMFLIENLLFSSSFTNNTNVLFTTCSGLNIAKLVSINGKEHNILRVINLFQIENWSKIKGSPNWISTALID